MMESEDIKFAFESDKNITSIIEYNSSNNKKAYLFVSNEVPDLDILPFNIMGTINATTSINGLYANMFNRTMPKCFCNFNRIILPEE